MKISVAVVTYNSSKTIVETLDSILIQDYGSQNLELIISDDGSDDNTIEIINKWLSFHKNSFFSTKLIINKNNQGVPSNCNKAWKNCSYDWIKTIAGDDILEPCCISANVVFISNHKECKIVFSRMRWFGSVDKITPTPYDLRFFKKSSSQQHKWLRRFSFNIAPSSFINKKALEDIGFANEMFKTIEDLPLWLKFTKLGYKLYFLDVITVNYRISESISMSDTRYMNIDFLNDLISINKKNASTIISAPITEIVRREQLLWFYLNLIIINAFDNKKNPTSILFGRATWIFRPVHILRHSLFKSYNSIALKVSKNH